MSTLNRPLYQHIAAAVDARINCQKSNNTEWFEKWTDRLRAIEKDHLPSGSGIDSGCTIDLDRSTGERIVIATSFHHMHGESGMYDGWTDHTVTITPAFRGIHIAISGRNRNDIKEYLADTFDQILTAMTAID